MGGRGRRRPLTIASGGVLNISGSVTLENVLTNAGTVTMTGAAIMTVYDNNSTYLGGVYNLAAALWDIQTNANIYCACYGNEFFNNAGTFRRSGGSSQSTVTVPFTNTGTINALAQILSFSGAFTNVGGTLAFGVSSLASFGQINVSGSVALNGMASATWLNGFTPAVGNSFAVLDYGSHSGSLCHHNASSWIPWRGHLRRHGFQSDGHKHNRGNQYPARLPEYQACQPKQCRRLMAVHCHQLHFTDQHESVLRKLEQCHQWGHYGQHQ